MREMRRQNPSGRKEAIKNRQEERRGKDRKGAFHEEGEANGEVIKGY